MLKRAAVTMFLICLSATICSATTAPEATKEVPRDNDWLLKHTTIQRLVDLTNQHRAQSGLPPVRLNAEMCLAAQKHAVWMASTGWFQHSGLPWPEIIFAGPQTPEHAIQGWIYSPAHHGIMLSGTEVGFGYMIRNGSPYWVGVFR